MDVRSLKRIPFRLLGFVLLAYVLYVTDLTQVSKQMHLIGTGSIAGAAAAFLLLLLFRCWRWHLLAGSLAADTPIARSFADCNESIWLGMATPGRVGEFTRGVYLSRATGVGLAAATALVAFDLVLDLLAYVLMAGAGVLLIGLGDRKPENSVVLLLAMVALVVGLSFVSAPIGFVRRHLRVVNKLPGLSLLLPALETRLRGKNALGVALGTLGAFLAYAWMMAILVAPMDLALDWRDTLVMVGVVGVSGAVPITYFGLGTREVALIWHFDTLGLSVENAVAVSFAFLFAQLIGIVVSLLVSAAIRLLGSRAQRN